MCRLQLCQNVLICVTVIQLDNITVIDLSSAPTITDWLNWSSSNKHQTSESLDVITEFGFLDQGWLSQEQEVKDRNWSEIKPWKQEVVSFVKDQLSELVLSCAFTNNFLPSISNTFIFPLLYIDISCHVSSEVQSNNVTELVERERECVCVCIRPC